MPEEISITDINQTHIADVLELARWLEMDAQPCSYWGLDEDAVTQLIKAPNKSTVVARIEDKVAGMGTLTRGEAFQSHLAELSVATSPDFRRRGIAKVIIGALEQLAQEKGIELLKGLISTKNIPSRKLCESLGYEHRATLYAEFKNPTFGEIDDCVYYKRIS
jgi:RimJ/RimL family protein N-acetyltransferase